MPDLRQLQCLLVFLHVAGCYGLYCDWTGSGVSQSGHDRVTTVSLNCAAGSLQWNYPRDALSVTLTLPSTHLSPHSPTPFAGCLHVTAHSANVRVFQRRSSSLLVPLWQPTTDSTNHVANGVVQLHPDRWRCFTSYRDRVTLYIEADSSENNRWETTNFSFDYELNPLMSEGPSDPMEECRPCNDVEILQSFCSSDFVVRGRFRHVDHYDELDRSRIGLDYEKIISARADIFNTDEPTRNKASKLYHQVSPDRPTVFVWAPRQCDVHSGHDSYIVTGRKRLGVAMVTCSLSVADWAILRRKAELNNFSECLLES